MVPGVPSGDRGNWAKESCVDVLNNSALDLLEKLES